MKKLAISALLIGGLFHSAGCLGPIVESDDNMSADGGVIGTDAPDNGPVLDVFWQVTPICPAGSIAQIMAKDKASNQVFVTPFSCLKGAGLTESINPGIYDVWIEVRSRDLSKLLAKSLVNTEVNATTESEIYPVQIPVVPLDKGYLKFTWSLKDNRGVTTCGQAGVSSVSITTISKLSSSGSNVETHSKSFSCSELAGQTILIPNIVEEITISAIGGNFGDAGVSSFTTTTVFDYGNQIKDIGNFEFFLDTF